MGNEVVSTCQEKISDLHVPTGRFVFLSDGEGKNINFVKKHPINSKYYHAFSVTASHCRQNLQRDFVVTEPKLDPFLVTSKRALDPTALYGSVVFPNQSACRCVLSYISYDPLCCIYAPELFACV